MRLRVLLFAALAACGGTPPDTTSGAFTLNAPATLKISPGSNTTAEIRAQRENGYRSKLTFTLDAPQGLQATLTPGDDSAKLSVTVPRDAVASKQLLTITATGDDGKAQSAKVELEVLPAPPSPTRTAGVSVKLDALFYASGAPVQVTVDFGALTAPSELGPVVLVSSESKDVETLTLTRGAGNTFTSSRLNVTAGSDAAVTQNSAFTVPAGGMFFAMFAIDRAWPGFESTEAQLVSDFAWVDGEREGAPPSRVEPMLKLTADEAVVPAGGRAVGTLLRVGTEQGDGKPVQIATEELIVFHSDDLELQRFVQASGGEALVTQQVDGDKPFASLVKVDPTLLTPARLALMRAFTEDKSELVASKPDALGIYALAMAFRLDGFIVAVNPRLQYQSVPEVREPERSALSLSMQMRGRAGSAEQCVPGDATRRCVTNAPAVWTYLDLLELDSRRVKVAVLDMGFAPNADFRTNPDGGIDQCDMTGRRTRCGAGTALGPPTVGASLVGAPVWHGTGVVTALGGVVDNGFGGAGTGGQLAVPMLYKYDLAAYAFDMGAGIRHAVDSGAGIVNISAGYPCTAVTRVGPDFEYCSVEGRIGICAVVTAAVHAAALVFCTSPAAGIPLFGAIACIALGTAAVIATDACLSTLALGNVRAPMASAIAYATSRGVPVVNSAGNRLAPESLPEVVRVLLDLSEARTERWGMIPATLPDVIVAGAVSESDLGNEEFFGDRVDVWAPINTTYIAPSITSDPSSSPATWSINGTSAAAPYVAGVIAAMQAVNPSLDPSRATPAERATAVSRIRTMLRTTATTNAQLFALGWANDPVERRNLIDPLAAVLEAGRGVQPDLSALGYDNHLNFDELSLADDVQSGARAVTFGTPVSGTTFAFDPTAPDRDWKTFSMPVLAGRVFATDVTVQYLGDDSPLLSSPGIAFPLVSTVPTGVERTATYRVVRQSGDVVPFAVTNPVSSGADSLYKLTVAMPAALAPTLAITNPVVPAGATLCANRATTFTALGTYPYSSLTVGSVTWAIDGVTQGSTALSTPFTRPPGTDTFTATAFGTTASLTVTFVTCSAIAEILTPSANIMQYAPSSDAFGPYLNINFSGRAIDAMGMVINPSTLVFEWTTNRGDIEPGAPATGSQLLGTGPTLSNVHIHCIPGSVAETHIITLTVRASAGGPVLSTDSVIITVQNLI